MSIGQIIEGTMNNLLDRETDLFEKRITICRACKLLRTDKIFGEICNPLKYLNAVTNELSLVQKPGFKRGCGCVLSSKCRVKEAHCPLNKW